MKQRRRGSGLCALPFFLLAAAPAPAAAQRPCETPDSLGPSRDLYCMELIPAPGITGVSGRVELEASSGPFTVDVTADGRLRYRPVLTAAGLPAPESLGGNRPVREPRVLNAMAPAVRDDYLKIRNEIDSTGKGFVPAEGFKASMAFEKRFVEAGGLLAAGVDPTGVGGALAGYGDQRNYELLLEAGFTPAKTIQIMTLNGARILGVDKQLGTVEKGKLADLVVLQGDLTQDPTVIRNSTTVFKDGIGYDSAKLIESVQGRVGID